jgi:hypothetical protein
MECRHQSKALPVKVEIIWMRGHQDKEVQAVLDWWARHNISTDTRAKRHGKKWKGQVLGPIQLSTEQWAFTVNELKHSRFNKEEICELRKEEASKIRWQRKDAITDQAWQNIDWLASKVALKEQSRGFRCCHAKNSTRCWTTTQRSLLTRKFTRSCEGLPTASKLATIDLGLLEHRRSRILLQINLSP